MYSLNVSLVLLNQTGHWFNIKMSYYQYRNYHWGDKMTLRLSFLHNGILYTCETISSYWIRPEIPCMYLYFHNSVQVIHELRDFAKPLGENERWVCLLHDEMAIKSDLVSISASSLECCNAFTNLEICQQTNFSILVIVGNMWYRIIKHTDQYSTPVLWISSYTIPKCSQMIQHDNQSRPMGDPTFDKWEHD